MVRLCVVTEFSFLQILILVAYRQPILILDIEPLLPFTYRALSYLISILVERKLIHWAIDRVPELKRVKEVPRRVLLYDVFGQIETWQNSYFGFANADQTVGKYGLAYKKAVTNYIAKKHVCLLTLRTLLDGRLGKSSCGVGIPEDTQGALKVFCESSLKCGSSIVPFRLINFTLFIGSIILCLIWVLRRTRIYAPSPKRIFVAADFIGDTRDNLLYRELEEGGEMLMVARGGTQNTMTARELSTYEVCERGDGFLFWNDFFPCMKMVFHHLWTFNWFYSHVHPALFRRLMALVYQRLLYRGLFSRFRPKYFWGRDPYSEDHIIRRQELNRVGGRSFGVNSGYLTWSILLPEYRYLSFDRYYVFGRGKYKKYYGNTWAEDMDVIPSGSFSGTRQHYASRFKKRSLDIAVFSSVFVGEIKFSDFVNEVAKSFPERRVILQMKCLFDDLSTTPAFVERSKKYAPNVEISTATALDVLEQVGYSFSDPSSVVVEALQFGAISFAFDMPELQKENINREYSGLVVTSATEAICRIRNIEAGTWRYPIENFEDAVDFSGMVFFDRIRRDMGLIPKEPSISLLSEHVEN